MPVLGLVLVVALVATACTSGGGGTAKSTSETVRVVSQNLLHGIACPADSNRCRLPDRVALFTRELERSRCPELVALQEANRETEQLLVAAVPAICGGRYHIVYDGDSGLDRELVLTTDRVLGSERVRLAGPLRTALWVRVAAAVGPVDLVTTHLASSSDDRPCDRESCPPPCTATEMLNPCQARQAAKLLDARRGQYMVGILAGDLNAKPHEPTIRVLRGRGYVDTHVAAGNAECDETTGAECTSGRIDDALTDLTNASSRQTERIDYVWLAPIRRCRVVRPTGLFVPNGLPDGAGGLVFPADHTGVEATIRCFTTAADRARARRVVRASNTTTTRPTSVPPETRAAVTKAFETVFNGSVTDPNVKLSALEDGEALRASLLARIAQIGPLATRTAVRIDSMTPADTDHVDVTYTILLDGAVVLDALPGRAVKVGDTWLVSRRTYCQVATLGIDTIPEPCR